MSPQISKMPSCDTCTYRVLLDQSEETGETLDYENSPCARCPLAKDDYFQSSEIGYDNSFLEQGIKTYLFIMRILSALKNRRTLVIARILLSGTMRSPGKIAKRLRIKRESVIFHVDKLKRLLPEIFKRI